MNRFVAVIDGVAGSYGVSFPDAEGCTAMGETIDLAISRAEAALAEWCADVRADGGVIAPRSVDELFRGELAHCIDIIALIGVPN